MLELTAGGRCVSGEEAVEFFEGLAGVVLAEKKDEYEYALNRLRAEVQKSVPVAPKAHKGSFTNYTCGKCGFGVSYDTDKYCRQCGRAIDWSESL